ncbi:MAG: DUF3892 domain-containing protein [Chloroflexi bacterium]|nr:MAG: DUF3892 domain-containing protein [Chloroflexota bacterium]
MTQIKITGIRKDNGNHENPHEAVTHYRWESYDKNGKIEKNSINPRNEVVGWLEGSLGFKVEAYVERVQPRAYCFVNVSRYGTKFLQTRPDATDQNNLLKLPEV